MQHWKAIFQDDIYELNYESLINNQEQESKNLLMHCDLAWEETCLNFHQSKRLVSTASYAQVRKPIYRDSLSLSEKYGASLDKLKQALAE